MERKELKEKEIEFLAQEYKKNPQLFERRSFVEGPECLKKFGIFIKNQKDFPLGFIKLWPQDFIVEEVLKDGEIQTIYKEDLFRKGLVFKEQPTTYATLVKCGISTIEAIEEISNFLNIEKRKIQCAGIKDKNAITSQKISIRNIDTERLKELSSPYFFLKNTYISKGVMQRGGLGGNKFTLLIRTKERLDRERTLKNLEKIKKQGFYNFYYLQRFGTPRLVNFYWAFLILKGNYKKAVFDFLGSPQEREIPYFKEIRQKIKENLDNWEKIANILEPFPVIFQNEIRVVSYLKENPKDFKGALNQIPEQITLWLFAFSSLLFNYQLSYFIKNERELPERFPLFLSPNRDDWLFYKRFLEKMGVFPPPFKNLRPFPYIRLIKREVDTKKNVKIYQVKIVPEGIILSFYLPKGAYATTFLAHLFQLISGMPPEEISQEPADTKASLGEKPIKETLERFKDVIYPAGENIFKKTI